MKDKINLIRLKTKISLLAVIRTYKNYWYIVLSVLIAVLFFEFLYWFLNYKLFWFLLTSGSLDVIEKFNLIFGSSLNYFSGKSVIQSLAVVLLSVLQGVVIAQIIFILRNQKTIDGKAFSGSLIASAVALFSVGCVSCGTSIVTPILSIFVSGVSAGLSESIHQASIYIGLIFAFYALFAIGQTVANIQAKSSLKQN